MPNRLKFRILGIASGLAALVGLGSTVFAQSWPCPFSDPVQMPEFRRFKLAESVEFPSETTRRNSRGLDYRVVVSSVTHAAGHVVELLTDAGSGVQIGDPVSRRVVWVPRSKLGEEVPPVSQTPSEEVLAEPFKAFTVPSPRPIRFPLRQPDGMPAGAITMPTGESLSVIADKGDYYRVKARQHTGWIRKTGLDTSSDKPLSALASLPSPRTRTAATVFPTNHKNEESELIPFRTSNSHAYRELVPLELTARVLGRRNYPIPGQKGGFWGTEVMPVDLALVWGPFLNSDRVRVTEMGYRSAHFVMQHREIGIFADNFHIVVDDPEVRKQLKEIKVGDTIRLEGALIRLEHPRGRADPTQSTITGSFGYMMLCRSVHKSNNAN